MKGPEVQGYGVKEPEVHDGGGAGLQVAEVQGSYISLDCRGCSREGGTSPVNGKVAG